MRYPPKSSGSRRGILSLEKKYGADRPVAACACATQKPECCYQAVRQVLGQGEDADFLPDEDGSVHTGPDNATPPVHKNIRGREYYGQTSSDVKNEDNNGDK